jgi:hypothetical protein
MGDVRSHKGPEDLEARHERRVCNGLSFARRVVRTIAQRCVRSRTRVLITANHCAAAVS